jgi:hypothetical protein
VGLAGGAAGWMGGLGRKNIFDGRHNRLNKQGTTTRTRKFNRKQYMINNFVVRTAAEDHDRDEGT